MTDRKQLSRKAKRNIWIGVILCIVSVFFAFVVILKILFQYSQSPDTLILAEKTESFVSIIYYNVAPVKWVWSFIPILDITNMLQSSHIFHFILLVFFIWGSMLIASGQGQYRLLAETKADATRKKLRQQAENEI